MVLICVAVGLGGCVAYRIPAEDRVLSNGNELIPLALQPSPDDDWQGNLLRESVTLAPGLQADPEADITVALEQNDMRCFTEPMLTVVTLGIIPTVHCRDYGYRLVLDDGSKQTSIDAQGEVTAVYGWAGLFMIVLPDWTGERGVQIYEALQLEGAIRRALDEDK